MLLKSNASRISYNFITIGALMIKSVNTTFIAYAKTNDLDFKENEDEIKIFESSLR